MKAWEWCAWGIMRLIGLVFDLAALLVAGLLGLIFGLFLFSAWIDGTLYQVLLAMGVIGGGIVAFFSVLCFAIDLHDRLELKRDARASTALLEELQRK